MFVCCFGFQFLFKCKHKFYTLLPVVFLYFLNKQNSPTTNTPFKNNSSKIDELEKEPAYKRHGLDLEHQEHNYNPPKTVIETDENDDIKLKSNNSFLHDNVDQNNYIKII